MTEPIIAQRKPYFVELQQGRTYYWCSCGRSKRQPFCDGSHAGTDFQPVAYTPQEAREEVLFCGCKQTCQKPFCDGSHNNLPGAYREDDPNSDTNRLIPSAPATDGPIIALDGVCYVFRPSRATLTVRGAAHYCTVIGPEFGAQYQSQFYLEARGRTDYLSFGDRHVVLFVQRGEGQIHIGARSFSIAPTDGVYVRPGEACALEPESESLVVFISACPAATTIDWPDSAPAWFDADWPERVVKVDASKRQAMAARFFQMLVDKHVGSTVATQFIGHIPFSKAEPHRHLYEEALILVEGHGCLWTETRKTNVQTGDVMFLPRKQLHSLQCIDAAGMDVAGVIYPGDNPSINY